MDFLALLGVVKFVSERFRKIFDTESKSKLILPIIESFFQSRFLLLSN